ncbi:MAG: hypothetical protein O4804_03235 [Trichodesmium sp. St11_bin5]|nr:hypothetical protein [Trichodesmium sp. St11_bin5]
MLSQKIALTPITPASYLHFAYFFYSQAVAPMQVDVLKTNAPTPNRGGQGRAICLFKVWEYPRATYKKNLWVFICALVKRSCSEI